MIAARFIEIPDEIANDDELKAWFEKQLGDLQYENSLNRRISLLSEVVRFYKKAISNGEDQFHQETLNIYKGLLVSTLMDAGWEIKTGNHRNKMMGPNAIDYFKRALTYIPENPKACYRLGHLSKSQERLGEAVGFFSKALELASKQSNFQEDLKLSEAQIANASGQSIALLQGLVGSFELSDEFTFDPEQIYTLQNLLRDTWYSHVVYSTINGRAVETKTIDSTDYDHMIGNLRGDPKAFVIDRYNPVSLIRYLNNEFRYDANSPSVGRLNYLLKALTLEDWEPHSMRPNTISQHIHRVNEDLQRIGIYQWLQVGYSQADGESRFTAKCDLAVHYFKTLLD